MTVAATTPVTEAVASADADVAALDPALHRRFRAELPRAADTVARRLLAALHREDLAGVRAAGGAIALPAGRVAVQRHGFDRAEPVGPLPGDPLDLIAELTRRTGQSLEGELGSAVVNLAVAYARRPSTVDPFTVDGSADERALAFERLATDGHNLHPCGRTRLGWDVADVLAHDLEAPGTRVEFVAMRRDRHVGEDVGGLLGRGAPSGFVAQPVHGWQLQRLRKRHGHLFAADAVRPLDGAGLPAAPTAALRTVLLPGDRYLKLSLDIQVTSTRRTISVASTRNGPVLSVLLRRLLAGERVQLLEEVAGAAYTGDGADRDLAAIVRSGLSGRLAHGETAVPAGALPAALPGARTVAAALVARYAASRGRPDDAAAARAFLHEYARLLLPPLLRLATRYGVALEAHLQNCLPTFVGGVPHRMVLRDFAGLRVHLPRLAARGGDLRLWPGSVIGTADVDVMRAKLAYTAFQAHLGELVLRLADSHGLDEPAAWRLIRGVVDEVYGQLRTDRSVAADAAADQAFLTAPRVPHKALVRMRLTGGGDVYVPVANPLR